MTFDEAFKTGLRFYRKGNKSITYQKISQYECLIHTDFGQDGTFLLKNIDNVWKANNTFKIHPEDTKVYEFNKMLENLE